MTWTKLGDEYGEGPEFVALSQSAILLDIFGLKWCNRHLTDGRLPKTALPMLAAATKTKRPNAAAAQLVAASVWIDDGDAWQLDWSEQEPAENVRVRKERSARKQRDYRERKDRHARGDHSFCDPRFCGKAADVTGNATGPRSAPVSPVPSEGQGTGTGGTDAAQADAGQVRSTGDGARLCVECTQRRPIATMTQDPQTGMWSCTAHLQEAS